jgi:hypothetical protein
MRLVVPRPPVVAAAAGLALLAACASPTARPPVKPVDPNSGADVVARMHARWAGRWFRTLAFTQQNTRWTREGAEDASTWFEWLQVPGRLRIEFLPAPRTGTSAGVPIPASGAIYADGRVISIADGRAGRTQEQLNVLLLLTADVYGQPVAESVKQLVTLGVDLTTVRRDTFDTRPVWVVGAAKGNLKAPQFWIDTERWTALRVVDRPAPQQGRPAPSTEYRLGDYRDVDGVPVVHEITFLRDGQRFFRERYTAVRTNERLDSALFDPARWRRAR